MDFASLAGIDTLDANLAALPDRIARALAAKASVLAHDLVDRVHNDKLAGSALNARSGALAASIDATVTVDETGVVASVGSFGDVKYAAIQEYGGKTAAHDIVASGAKVLAFVEGGAEHFARVVHHPGSQIPARSYLRASLDEMSAEIVDALSATPIEAWGGA